MQCPRCGERMAGGDHLICTCLHCGLVLEQDARGKYSYDPHEQSLVSVALLKYIERIRSSMYGMAPGRDH